MLLALWSKVPALSRRLVVLLRIRTGMDEVDWVAKVKWEPLKESSAKCKEMLQGPVHHYRPPPVHLKPSRDSCPLPLLDNMEDFPGPDAPLRSFTFLEREEGVLRPVRLQLEDQ